jgi:hypothetical protein
VALNERLVLSPYEIDGPDLYQVRPATKVTGYIYEVHLRGLQRINVIPTATEGSRFSFDQSRRRGAAST